MNADQIYTLLVLASVLAYGLFSLMLDIGRYYSRRVPRKPRLVLRLDQGILLDRLKAMQAEYEARYPGVEIILVVADEAFEL